MKQAILTPLRRTALCLMLAFSAPALADERLQIPRAARAPVLADYIGQLPADAGVEIKGLRQYAPGDGEASLLETKAYLSYDDEHLYAVFVCTDDPALVRARIARREDLPGDDAVQLEIDSFNDKQRSFRFYANPYGVQMDAKHTEGLGDDFNFDTQWQSDGRITPTGYVVTMAIPFKSLRFNRADVQNWGIAVGRIVPRLNEFSYWPYITKRQAAFVPQLAPVQIAEPITSGRNIQLIPYGYIGRSRALNGRDPARTYWERDDKNQAGLDAKLVLADKFALDLTYKPDFSEVESDEPQVLIDKRYEVLFPEKRPFFLENSGFFTTPQPLFFSRRIAEPRYGARLTGREGHWSVGGLLMDDLAPGEALPRDSRDHGKAARIAVARVQNDFAGDSNVGVLLTDRKFGQQSNRVAGVDLRYKIDENWVLTSQLAHSKSSLEGQPGHSGRLAFVEASRSDRNFNYAGQYLDITRDFDPALAFIPRTDIRQTTQTASYLWNFPDAPWLVSAGPSIKAVGTRDHDNVLQDWSSDAFFSVNGLRATTFEAHKLDAFEKYAGLDFRKSGFSLAASTEWLSWLTGWVTAGQNEVINYQPAAGIAPFLGDARSISANLKFTPVAQFRVEQTLYWNDLRTQAGVAGLPAGSMVYRDLLSRTKLRYQHSRFLAAHLILDYSFLKTNRALTGIEGGKRLTGDLLFSYVLSPGTTAYAGYTDRQENLQLIGNPQLLQRTRDLDMHTGRKVFVKFSYLFQL